MSERTCGNCAWWSSPATGHAGDNSMGECRYVAPEMEGFPVTMRTAWCRHHTTTRGWEDEAQPETSGHGRKLIRLLSDWAKEANRLNNEVKRLRKRQQEAAQLFIELGTDVELDAFPVAADWEKRRLVWMAGMAQEDNDD